LPYAIINWQICQDGSGWPLSFSHEEPLVTEIIPANSDQNAQENNKATEESQQQTENDNQVATPSVNGINETDKSNNENNIEKNECNENNSTQHNPNEEATLTTPIENQQEIEAPKDPNVEAQDDKHESETNEENQEAKLENKETDQTSNPVKNETNPDQMAVISIQPAENGSLVTAPSPSANQPATTPNGNSASSTTPSATTPTPTTTTTTTPNKASYYKSTPTFRHNPTLISPYIYPSAVTNVQPYHPYGVRLPYHQQLQLRTNSILQNAAALATSPFGTFAAPSSAATTAVQQPVFLCRTPNGLAYVTAQSPNVLGAQTNVTAAHQLALAQAQAQMQAQVQAQAIIQQQQQQSIALAAAAAHHQQQQQQLAASFQTSPSSSQAYQKYANPTISPNNAVQIQAHQMIYQAAAQPANSAATAQTQAKLNSNSAQQQTVTAQSPKPATTTPASSVVVAQQQSNAQVAAAQAAMYAQMNQVPVVSYSGNPSYYTYSPMGSSATAASNPAVSTSVQMPQQLDQTTANTNASNLILSQATATQNGQSNAAAYLAAAQQNQLYAYAQQQQAQAQQQAQVQAQQNAQTVSAANLNGLFQAAQANPTQTQLSHLATIQTPTGYQLVDYRQLQAAGLAPVAAAANAYPGVANIQFDQLAGNTLALARPRLFTNLRHHPYQRN
jgi:hypothetical protein